MVKNNSLTRLWELAENEHRGLVLSAVCAFIGVVGGIVPYFAASQIIIALIGGNVDFRYYIFWCAVMLVGYFAKTVFYVTALSVSHKATFSVLKNIREKLLMKLPKLPLGSIIDTKSGKMKQIIVDQVESIERPLAHLLPEMTSNLVVSLLILIYLFVLDWRMALLSLVSVPIGLLFMGMAGKDYAVKYDAAVQKLQYMNSTVVEYIGGIEVIKAFNQGKKSYAKFSDSITAVARYYYDWMKQTQPFLAAAKTIAPTTLITILPLGWLMYSGGSLSIETFILTIMLSLGVATPLITAINYMEQVAKIGTVVEAVDSILLAEEQVHSEELVQLDGTDIALSDVSFSYHEDKEVLHKISLNIPAGSITAFVGESGSGKSTIAKLIAGFWEVSAGSITLGGHTLQSIPLTQLYDNIAFVSQDTFLFDETVRENIRMGRLDATDKEVEEVARLSGCDGFIRELENGYDTIAGSCGSNLSGGERQRIAIARAMLKNAPVVILDEATAYIDPENEAVIQGAVAKLVHEKTLIVIAHRLSTVTAADNIVLVCDGKIGAMGTHIELLQKNELYQSMWAVHLGTKEGEAL